MKFSDLKEAEGRISGLVAVERVFPREVRSLIKRFLLVIAPFLGLILFYLEVRHFLPAEILLGLLILTIAAWIVLFMIDAFFYSAYFRDLRNSIPEWGIRKPGYFEVGFDVAEIVAGTNVADFTAGFVQSRTGLEILSRLEISAVEAKDFLSSSRKKVYTDQVKFEAPIDIVAYSKAVFDFDADFSGFLAARNIRRADFLATAAWVRQIHEKQKTALRWWGLDSLGRIRSIGKNWSRGDIYLLEQYGERVVAYDSETFFKREIDNLEEILSRSSSANAILVADDKNDLKAVVSGLAKRIMAGSVLPQIEHKMIFGLNLESIGRVSSAPGQFDTLMIRLFNQAVEASDIVIVIPDLEFFIELAKRSGSDPVKLFDFYFLSSGVQIVVLSTNSSYDRLSIANNEFVEKFEKIVVGGGEQIGILRALEGRVSRIERRGGIFFTYQSLKAIIDLAGQVETELKAMEILHKLVPRIVERKIKRVTADDVRELNADPKIKIH